MADNKDDIRLKGNSGSSEDDKKIVEGNMKNTDSSRIKKAEINDDVHTRPVLKPQAELNSGESVLDPMTLRDSDTSRLKRIKPKSETQTINLDDNVTDTVHLKVIKEKKKQLAGILTASQTIRLRPPSNPPQAAPQAPPAAPVPGAPAAPPQSAQTLKLSPTPSPGGTVNMPPAQPAGTLKINMPASSSESGTIKVSKPNFSQAASAGTLKIKSGAAPDASAAGGTLKIKSAAPTASASGTLKIKSPSEGDQTVKMNEAGGTLKLKAKSTASSPAPQATGARQAARPQEEAAAAAASEVEDPKAKPGIFMTLSALVACGLIGTIVAITVNGWVKLFTEQAGQ